MTYDYWETNFKPIKNNLTNGEDLHFETYGNEDAFVREQDNHNIWTEVDGDSGTYIIAGYHWVNRIHYYITEEKWDDEYTEIPTWCYRQCDCAEDEQYEDMGFNPDCEEHGCEEGTIDIPCDTVEDLKQIYGEDNNDIVG
jgi:hypothetical protein